MAILYGGIQYCYRYLKRNKLQLADWTHHVWSWLIYCCKQEHDLTRALTVDSFDVVFHVSYDMQPSIWVIDKRLSMAISVDNLFCWFVRFCKDLIYPPPSLSTCLSREGYPIHQLQKWFRVSFPGLSFQLQNLNPQSQFLNWKDFLSSRGWVIYSKLGVKLGAAQHWRCMIRIASPPTQYTLFIVFMQMFRL